MNYQNGPRNHLDTSAAILVDYSNIRKVTAELLGDSEAAGGVVLRFLDEAKKYVCRQLGFRVVRMLCFDTVPPADHAGHEATAPLLSMGAEPRFVHGTTGSNAASIALTIQATELLQSPIEIDTFLILAGDRWYVPLAHYLQRNGRNVIVAALETPAETEQVPSDLAEAFFNTRKLLEKAARQENNGRPLQDGYHESAESDEEDAYRPSDVLPIDDPIARTAMEIIENHFGQYREIYLTPLLRKMTELLEHEEEPKSLINYLEECGAVWLEKRRGFPHNYTVLLVNEEHPDVADIKEAFDRNGRDTYYEDDGYAEPADVDEFTEHEPYEEARD